MQGSTTLPGRMNDPQATDLVSKHATGMRPWHHPSTRYHLSTFASQGSAPSEGTISAVSLGQKRSLFIMGAFCMAFCRVSKQAALHQCKQQPTRALIDYHARMVIPPSSPHRPHLSCSSTDVFPALKKM